MEKKLVLKLKRDKEIKDLMVLQTQDEKYDIAYFEEGYILLNIFELIGIDFDEIDKIEATTSLNSLVKLISKGFSIRVDESEKGYNLIVSRDKCSMNFTATKEQGFAKVMIDAENWSETLLEEIQNCCTIRNV